MSLPIEDYAIIGDMRTTALISREGSIDWLCWPRHDSAALFLRLLDDDKGGFSDITISDQFSSARRYTPATNVLETTFVSATGRAVLLDFMPVRFRSSSSEQGPDSEGENRIIRLISCVEGRILGAFRSKPTFNYAREGSVVSQNSNWVQFSSNTQSCTVLSDLPIHLDDNEFAAAPFDLSEGQQTYLVLQNAMDDGLPSASIDGLQDVLGRLDQTLLYWTEWSKKCTYEGPYLDVVLRSALCLKLLTYAPSGAIIAAPTLGLPEAIPGNRNYDYRYSWLRDASFCVTSFVNLGYIREATEYLRYLSVADDTRGKNLQLMYAIAGDIPREEPLPHLAGWQCVGPVGIGNAALEQSQHDIYGEFLIALHFWLEAIRYDKSILSGHRLPELVTNLANCALAYRDEPDRGIWELRTDKQHNLHTKALIAIALERAAAIAEQLREFEEELRLQWLAAAKYIRDEYLIKAWSEKQQAYVQFYGSNVLDASVMRIGLFGGIDPSSPRMKMTINAIEKYLAEGDLIYRYKMDDGLLGVEATFTACAFWRVGCLTLSGELSQAETIFRRLIAMGNDVGLFAEEIDAASGEQRGNFPQAFTHMAIINHAIRLRDINATAK